MNHKDNCWWFKVIFEKPVNDDFLDLIRKFCMFINDFHGHGHNYFTTSYI